MQGGEKENVYFLMLSCQQLSLHPGSLVQSRSQEDGGEGRGGALSLIRLTSSVVDVIKVNSHRQQTSEPCSLRLSIQHLALALELHVRQEEWWDERREMTGR